MSPAEATAEVRLDGRRRRVVRCMACGWSLTDDATEAFPAAVVAHLRNHRDQLELPGFEAQWRP